MPFGLVTTEGTRNQETRLWVPEAQPLTGVQEFSTGVQAFSDRLCPTHTFVVPPAPETRIVIISSSTGYWANSTATSSSTNWVVPYPGGTSTSTSTTVTSAGTYYVVASGIGTPVQWSYLNTGACLTNPKRGPLIKKSVKSSIKRALSLMANFGMEEDAKVFLGGNEIEVSHPDSMFKFVLSKKYHSVIARTEYPGHSTPYHLSLFTKTDVHVADLCVYMEDTPMLDQVLALSMFVKTGNEDQLLKKANFRALCSSLEFRKQLAVGNPMLQKKLRVDAVQIQ